MANNMVKFNKEVIDFMSDIADNLKHKLTISEDGENELAFKLDVNKNIKMLETNIETLAHFTQHADYYSNLNANAGVYYVDVVNRVLRSARRANSAAPFMAGKWRRKARSAMNMYQRVTTR